MIMEVAYISLCRLRKVSQEYIETSQVGYLELVTSQEIIFDKDMKTTLGRLKLKCGYH